MFRTSVYKDMDLFEDHKSAINYTRWHNSESSNLRINGIEMRWVGGTAHHGFGVEEVIGWKHDESSVHGHPVQPSVRKVTSGKEPECCKQ